MKKLEILLQKINEVQITNLYEEAAKKKIIAAYTENEKKLEEVPVDKIRSFPYKKQITQEAFVAKRADSLKEVTVKLERHMYAPELNCLHFKNGTTFKVKDRDFPAAIATASINMKESDFKKAISPIKK